MSDDLDKAIPLDPRISPTDTKLIRVRKKDFARALRLAKPGQKMPDIFAEMVRCLFFKRMNDAAEALRNDPEAWTLEQKERALWANADRDGLD
jgi:hypothetical protein